MPFPDSPRVKYASNSLNEVICQFRFPPILKIEAEAPVVFQEEIRAAFPLYQEKLPQVQLPPNLPLPKEIVQALSREGGVAREFSSEDEIWCITLTRDFLALTCKKYSRWEEFYGRLEVAAAALRKVYAPAFYTRIGLRYRNIIQRSVLGLQSVPWRELLPAHVVGIIAQEEISRTVEHSLAEAVVGLMEYDGHVHIKHGLLAVETSAGEEQCYMIDADFFANEKTGVNDAEGKLRYFNRKSGCLFRWFITEKLHNAMEPSAI